jgi:hemoglobin-like flavoprotein
MTAKQKTLVQQSFAGLGPISDTVAELFYRRLFHLDPSLRQMFHGDMVQQGRKLMQMLALAVHGLDKLEQILPAVRSLGERHAVYGVTDAHYDTVASALLWTLEKGLGASFTPQVEMAWVEVYTLLAGEMKAGAVLAAMAAKT